MGGPKMIGKGFPVLFAIAFIYLMPGIGQSANLAYPDGDRARAEPRLKSPIVLASSHCEKMKRRYDENRENARMRNELGADTRSLELIRKIRLRRRRV